MSHWGFGGLFQSEGPVENLYFNRGKERLDTLLGKPRIPEFVDARIHNDFLYNSI
jgi:hypothetical protein